MQVTSTSTVPTAVAATDDVEHVVEHIGERHGCRGRRPARRSTTTASLKLLVAELQNQDPTNPTDPTQYLSQIASFSAVGQTVQTNQKLDTMITTNALQQADTAIGRTVTSADGTISGKVSSASIGSDGTITAKLANGTTLALGSGVTIS